MTTMYQNILITGGCGFVGSSLAMLFRQQDSDCRITCLDNLKRRGAELNLERLKAAGIEFIHGDIRVPEDLSVVGKVDLLIECAAEPSVAAGYNDAPAYVVATNMTGTYNCLELARHWGADLCFLSTSRVYPHARIEALHYSETETRFLLTEEQAVSGAGPEGISEDFSLAGPRSLYGATKLASELLIQEYIEMYGLRAVINRCGVLSGPGQFGKTDQGVLALWMAKHYWGRPLSYIGFGGTGKQVRDVLHVADLFRLLQRQLDRIDVHSGNIYNVGGGLENSVSLKELTLICQDISGHRIEIEPQPEQRSGDIRYYVSDIRKVTAATGWRPDISPRQVLLDIYKWIRENEKMLERILK